MQRSDITFQSGGTQCAAWLYRPPGNGGGLTPCVVMAHGFSATREDQLQLPAERFAAAGFAALVFDYRHFGDSDGEPRQIVDLRSQYEDWDAAIAFAREVDGIDSQRLVLWGTSFSGGHVIDAAVRHPEVAAVIAQTPFTDGLIQALRMPPRIGARLIVDGLRDETRRLRGQSPRMVPVAAPRGGYAAFNDRHVWDSIPVLMTAESRWRNEVAARIALRLPVHRPGRRASRVSCPLLVQVVEGETVMSNRAAERAARIAPRGEFRSYQGFNHFDIYVGEGFERLSIDQLDFLTRHLLGGNVSSPAAAEKQPA
jgi:fermentation-respiration switch protein FrsA (DUF1100 family)